MCRPRRAKRPAISEERDQIDPADETLRLPREERCSVGLSAQQACCCTTQESGLGLRPSGRFSWRVVHPRERENGDITEQRAGKVLHDEQLSYSDFE